MGLRPGVFPVRVFHQNIVWTHARDNRFHGELVSVEYVHGDRKLVVFND